MSDDEDGYKVLIWCRSRTPGHRKKGVVVAAFIYRGDGMWDQSVVGGHRRDWMTSGTSGDLLFQRWIDAEGNIADSEQVLDDFQSEYTRGLRSVYELACPVCSPGRVPFADGYGEGKGTNAQMTESLLFEILNGVRHAGLHELDLSQVRGIIHHRTSLV